MIRQLGLELYQSRLLLPKEREGTLQVVILLPVIIDTTETHGLEPPLLQTLLLRASDLKNHPESVLYLSLPL